MADPVRRRYREITARPREKPGRAGLALAAAARLGHLAMLLREHARRRHAGDGGLELVLPAADDVAVAPLHRIEPDAGDVSGIVLLLLADLGVGHPGAL